LSSNRRFLNFSPLFLFLFWFVVKLFLKGDHTSRPSSNRLFLISNPLPFSVSRVKIARTSRLADHHRVVCYVETIHRDVRCFSFFEETASDPLFPCWACVGGDVIMFVSTCFILNCFFRMSVNSFTCVLIPFIALCMAMISDDILCIDCVIVLTSSSTFCCCAEYLFLS
jgi:hypothetical protein